MKREYITPNIANYGSCAVVIQGNCGWGVENVTLDKTGYTRGQWRKWENEPCAGPDPNGNTNCWAVCQLETICADAHRCPRVGKRKKV